MDATRGQGDERKELRYRLEVEGPISPEWRRWLEADEVIPTGPITVLLLGVTDQAELYGRLRRIHDLNLRLLSLRLTDGKEQEGSPFGDDPPEEGTPAPEEPK